MPSSRSPEQHESSAWQVRFGKRGGTNQDTAFSERKSQQHQQSASDDASSVTTPSPSIGELLFSALKARECPLEPKEELSRDCAEQLPGKRNAFVPQLRMRDHEQQEDVEPKRDREKDGDEDDTMASAAREILQARFRCENQADEMRHLQKKKTTRAMEVAARSKKTDASTGVKRSVRSGNTSAEGARMRALHGNKSMFELGVVPMTRQERRPTEKSAARKPLVTTASRSGGTGSNATESKDEKEKRGGSLTPAAARQNDSLRQLSTRTLSRHANSNPLKQMEERQQRLCDKRAARMQVSARDNATTIATPIATSSLKRQTPGQRSSDLHTSSRNNRDQDEMQMAREQRLLQEKIARIAKENERAATTEAEWRHRQHVLQQQRFVFSVWRQQLDQQQRQVTRARHTFEWRWLQKMWVRWRQYTFASQHARIVEATKANLVRGKLIAQQADAFYRRKQVPIWFSRWSASVTVAKDARQLETAQQARKAQAQRLMERLVRQQDATGAPSRDDELEAQHATTDRSDRAVSTSHHKEKEKTHSRNDSVPRTSRSSGPMRKTAWVQCQEGSSATPSGSAPPSDMPSETPDSRENAISALGTSTVIPVVDPLYASMQERAAERKQRRELLKQKYEQADQEKREAIEMQRADREARWLEQKMNEKQRIKERKREEALATQEKRQRMEARALQQRARQWTLAKRVASSACAWHELRVQYASWHQWLHFVHLRHLKRRRIEQQKLERAALHHACALKRKVFRSLQGVHERIRALAVAVERQTRWNDLRRTWTYWQQMLVRVRWTQQQHEQRILQKWRVAKLRRLWIHWRAALAEWRQEQQEKAQLWAKVRTWLDE